MSFAGLIFSGDLDHGLYTGIGLGLFSAVVLSVLTACGGSFSGMMASPQDKPAAIAGVTVASISTSVAAPESLPTVIAFIAVTSMIFGVILFTAGYFRLGGLVRYLPYPVIGGFLAGTGVLILFGAFTFVGEPLQFQRISLLLGRESLIRWLPAFLFGLGLFVALKKSKHFMVLPGFITVGVIISYALFAFLGLKGPASQAGLLIGYLPEKLWEADILVKQAGRVDWGFILRNAPSIAAIVLISGIAMLLNETGVEVATRTRLDFNHDMRNTGIGNIIVGLGGGMAGYPLLGLSVLNYRIGVSSRFVGLLTALFTLFILFYGAGVLAMFPRWVVAGILFYLALDFLFEWLIDSRHTCSFLEYLLILVIMTGIVSLGILEGIALGVVIMTMVFVYSYSRIEVIKNEQTGTHRRSNVQRASALEKYLYERGQNTLILELQGYLFFGTTNRVLERVAEIFSTPGAHNPEYIVLDFRRVNGADSSSILSFLNLSYLAEKQPAVLVFTGLDTRLEAQLRRGGCLSNAKVCVQKPDLDRGIEWCENQILEHRNVFLEAFNLRELFENGFGSDQYGKLERYLKKREFSAGSIVFRQGETSDGMYFIESGAVSVILNEGKVAPVRLRKLGEGTLFGEMSVYTQEFRSASVQVENDAVIYFLSKKSMSQIELEAPDLANTFHRFVVKILSHRLEHSNSALIAQRH